MRGEVNVHLPKKIPGARECEFLLLCQIAEIEEAELAVGEQEAERLRVFTGIIRRSGFRSARRILLSRAGQGGLDRLARRGDHCKRSGSERHAISEFEHAMSMAGPQLLVCGVVRLGVRVVLSVGAVIEKCADLQLSGKLKYS